MLAWLLSLPIWLMLGLGTFPNLTLAHEAYVLTPQEFSQGISYTGLNEFLALQNPDNLRTFLTVTLTVIAILGANFFFRHSSYGRKLYLKLNYLSRLSPFPVRIALAVSFFYSAYTNSFLGPEIPITAIPFSLYAQLGFYLTSLLFFLGLFTELAAFFSLVFFCLGVYAQGAYLITYLNYLGEIIALLFFGSRIFSLDRLIFGRLKRFLNFQKYENTIIRVSYGLALAYAAISIKLLHPMLTELVIKRYNLTQFTWLFPHDPHLIVLGAGLSELVIGLFIILGFETRLVVLISLFYITLSLLYFREAVWPHLILYGISFNLLANGGGKLTLDNFFDNWLARHHLAK